uniref:Uncharacterized protein n=2 Tax=Hyaloperonospora arabidopsidis (strain Emoy2) TaxID=559515 RepID=M4BLY3_HYAAE
MLRMARSGRMTPMDAMPTPDLAVPYAAPRSSIQPYKHQVNHSIDQSMSWSSREATADTERRTTIPTATISYRYDGALASDNVLAKTRADATPMKPKNDADEGQTSATSWANIVHRIFEFVAISWMKRKGGANPYYKFCYSVLQTRRTFLGTALSQ